MPEQETEQPEEQPSDQAPNPFDTEIDVAEDGPADDEDVAAGSDETHTDEEVAADAEEAASDASNDEVVAEDPALAEEETPSPDEELVQAEPGESEVGPEDDAPARSTVEVMAIAEAIIFVSDEPITSKALGDIIGENKETIQAAVEELQREYEAEACKYARSPAGGR